MSPPAPPAMGAAGGQQGRCQDAPYNGEGCSSQPITLPSCWSHRSSRPGTENLSLRCLPAGEDGLSQGFSPMWKQGDLLAQNYNRPACKAEGLYQYDPNYGLKPQQFNLCSRATNCIRAFIPLLLSLAFYHGLWLAQKTSRRCSCFIFSCVSA